MKTGDLVRLKRSADHYIGSNEKSWVGVIIGWHTGDPVVMWNEDFQAEREYRSELEVINEIPD